MQRIMLRYAIEELDKSIQKSYLKNNIQIYLKLKIKKYKRHIYNSKLVLLTG